ncbi:DUF262 domain-containing protein [Actinomadura rubrisoli]|uniref:DUF262 domain-containing protein n=1 Tax=Actinomadura rubrisoli TaxID=2530368 RepID=A0A4R5B702_9ACTN|nr:DUF262 domain-containing protein [Actinomadura rubrisoli]
MPHSTAPAPTVQELHSHNTRHSSEGQVASHFLGAVVLAPSMKAAPELSQWNVVDGQQRLTTLMIALCAVRDHLVVASRTDQQVVPDQQVPAGRSVLQAASDAVRPRCLQGVRQK